MRVIEDPSELAQHRVEVVEPGQSAESGWMTCKLDHHIEFNTEALESYCLGDWDPLVYDAFVVAAAIEYCDRTMARRQVWGRDISLRVPVHKTAKWHEAGVGDVLAALTGDRWNLEFMPRKKPAPPTRQANLPMDSEARAVMPFSDGLDSYVVSHLMEKEYGKLLRVRLVASPARYGKGRLPFAGVPFRVRHCRSDERSVKSRAFKFGVLTGVAAFLSRLTEVIVAESGQGILGTSLVRMGPEHGDVRSHPHFLDRMAGFLHKLLGIDIRYVYPRIWHTKAQTLDEYFAMHPKDDDWRRTRSCWHDQRTGSVGGTWRQCGICSAYLLRRMSLQAAGRQEKGSAYIWENLAAKSFCDGAAAEYQHKGGAMRRHCVSGATDLDLLAKLRCSPSAKGTLDSQIRRLCRSPDIAASDKDDVRVKVERLLEQHASEWRAFKESLGEDSFLFQLLEGEGA